jgi:hypothetical protein
MSRADFSLPKHTTTAFRDKAIGSLGMESQLPDRPARLDDFNRYCFRWLPTSG